MRPRLLKSRTPEFRKFLAAIVARRSADSAGVDSSVVKIIDDVRKRGDRSLLDLTAKFDGVKLSLASLRVTPAERQSALNRIPHNDRDALELAARRIHDFHRRTLEKSFSYRDGLGMRLGQIVTALDMRGRLKLRAWAEG